MEWAAIQSDFRGSETDGKGFEGAGLVEGELGFQDKLAQFLAGASVDSHSGVLDTSPDNELWDATEGDGQFKVVMIEEGQ